MLEIMIIEIITMMTMIVMMMSTIWQIWPGLYPQGHGGASKELSRPPDWSSPNHINLITRDWSLPTIMILYLVCVPWEHVRDILLPNCEWRQWLNLKTFRLFVGKFKIKISVRWGWPESGTNALPLMRVPYNDFAKFRLFAFDCHDYTSFI